MTGINELRRTQVVSAAPEQIRVSVFGGRTQLDIALPVDVPVSGLVPDLARLIRSRDTDRDPGASAVANKDERRNFWQLSRFGDGTDGTALRPDQTLREAGVVNGELLRLSSERALSPPTLYDDVVDAVGRLNKVAHAAWGAASARWMAFVAVHLAAAGLVYCLIGGVDAPHHWVIVGLAAAVALTLVGGATMAHRSYRLDDVAAGLGWAAIPISAAIAWTSLARYGDYGLAAGCGAVLVLCALYDRVIRTGRWAYLACGLLFGLVGVALLGRALHLRADIVVVTLAVLATLLCVAVRRLTARLGRFQPPTVDAETGREDYDFDNPFESSAAVTTRDGDSGTLMPTAEAVWTKARSATITRAGLLAGLAAAAAVDVTTLLAAGGVTWPTFVFALACAAVLGLSGRTVDTWFERASVGVPAVAIALIGCVLAQNGAGVALPVTALGVLLAVAVGASLAGLAPPDGRKRRLATALAYAEYVAVGSLIPLAMWVVGGYQRLGL